MQVKMPENIATCFCTLFNGTKHSKNFSAIKKSASSTADCISKDHVVYLATLTQNHDKYKICCRQDVIGIRFYVGFMLINVLMKNKKVKFYSKIGL